MLFGFSILILSSATPSSHQYAIPPSFFILVLSLHSLIVTIFLPSYPRPPTPALSHLLACSLHRRFTER